MRKLLEKLKVLATIADIRKAVKQGGEGMYWEIASSVLRHFTPWALATLGALGVEVSPDTDSVILVVMAGVAYVGMQGWSIVRKMLNKPRKA